MKDSEKIYLEGKRLYHKGVAIRPLVGHVAENSPLDHDRKIHQGRTKNNQQVEKKK